MWRGGEGSDTYVLDFGYGQDFLEDTEGQNRLRFGAGILAPDLQGEWAGSALAVSGDTVGLDMA
jgi:hypothetical protein